MPGCFCRLNARPREICRESRSERWRTRPTRCTSHPILPIPRRLLPHSRPSLFCTATTARRPRPRRCWRCSTDWESGPRILDPESVMTMLTRNRCFGRPNTALSFLLTALPSSTTPGPGQSASCTGTTSSIGTVAFVMSAQPSAMPARISPFSRPDMPSIPQRVISTRRAGLVRHEIGRRSV